MAAGLIDADLGGSVCKKSVVAEANEVRNNQFVN
jgi:hypothetical protein